MAGHVRFGQTRSGRDGSAGSKVRWRGSSSGSRGRSRLDVSQTRKKSKYMRACMRG